MVPGFKAQALASPVLVEKVWTEPEIVEPGQQFKLNFTLKDIGTRDLENVVVKLISVEGKNTLTGFSPVGKTNDMFCEYIEKGNVSNVSINLMADSQLKVGAYNLIVNIGGKEKYSNNFEDNKIIGIILANKPNLIITSLDTEEDKIKKKNKLKLNFVNSGKATLSDVMLNITANDKKVIKYFGTLEPGDENSYDYELEMGKAINGKVELTFKDELNKQGSVTKDFQVKAANDEAKKDASNEKKGFFASVGTFFKRLLGLGG
jgi:hypothetical protein